jgi:hypothetical protein
MGARVFLNNQLLGTVSDQFLRYSFSAKSALKAAGQSNQLAVEFDESIEVDGRFMACSGGWDWCVRAALAEKQLLETDRRLLWPHRFFVIGHPTPL